MQFSLTKKTPHLLAFWPNPDLGLIKENAAITRNNVNFSTILYFFKKIAKKYFQAE